MVECKHKQMKTVGNKNMTLLILLTFYKIRSRALVSEAYLVDVLSSSDIILVATNAEDVSSNQDQKQPKWLKTGEHRQHQWKSGLGQLGCSGLYLHSDVSDVSGSVNRKKCFVYIECGPTSQSCISGKVAEETPSTCAALYGANTVCNKYLSLPHKQQKTL